jgi:hypothetical protein
MSHREEDMKKDKDNTDDLSSTFLERIRKVTNVLRGFNGEDQLFPFAFEKEEKRKAEEKAREEFLKNQTIGWTMGSKGVHLGATILKDDKGKSLGEFDLYAAPEDISDACRNVLMMRFNEVVKYVAGIDNYYGYAGFNHMGKDPEGWTPDTELYNALRSGEYNGEWFIPTRDILEEHLYKKKDMGSLKGSFMEAIDTNGSVDKGGYWGCTRHPGQIEYVSKHSMEDGIVRWGLRDYGKMPTRLVRAEPR